MVNNFLSHSSHTGVQCGKCFLFPVPLGVKTSGKVNFLVSNYELSFIQKEFYQLGKVKGVECEVLILTNLLTKQKMGCLRLKTTCYNRVGSNDTYIGTLDSDELS